MKTVVLTAVTCFLALGLAGVAAAEDAKTPDGIYTATAKGYKGPVTIRVGVKNGRIYGVRVSRHREDRPRNAIKGIPKRIVATQSTEVDVVTHASVTSRAIMKATREALASATRKPAEGLPDGVYAGKARGYVGTLIVKFRVRGGRFIVMKVTKHRENRARTSIRDIPKRMVEWQKVEVDAVTRATVTSRAIIKAVRGAIRAEREKAKKTKGALEGAL
jgi:NosR/NirI family transcriptional regulator, nitrous oxide reductase regulator